MCGVMKQWLDRLTDTVITCILLMLVVGPIYMVAVTAAPGHPVIIIVMIIGGLIALLVVSQRFGRHR